MLRLMTTDGYSSKCLINVVGLPLAEIVDVLTSCGVIAPGRG